MSEEQRNGANDSLVIDQSTNTPARHEHSRREHAAESVVG